jgi:serine/threonine protein kinase/DNA-binding winged helix-turn-helix (wHTH) protein/tetratricopeptide (TPR) repeat protein
MVDSGTVSALAMKETLPARVRLGEFEFDPARGELRCGNDTLWLTEKPFRVLLVLIDHGGGFVSREEIKKKLWPNNTMVDFDRNINTTMRVLRKALGDSADEPKYIETVARRGYRLLVPIERLTSETTHASVEPGAPPDTHSGGNGTVVCLQPQASLIGQRVSHYRVLEVIGGGGMGMVYKAEDLKLGRHVALKFLPPELAGDAVALQRFEREARAASSLDHPNICTIHEVEEHDRQPFIVMQLLHGETVRDRLATLAAAHKKVALDELLDIAIQICNGLEVAHAKGIVHRDIKPANIFLTSSGQVKILDFGLAKLVEQVPGVSLANEDCELKGRGFSRAVAASAFETSEVQPRLGLNLPSPENNDTGDDAPKGAPLQFRASPDATLTRFGVALGTAGYMSPEQVRGDALDARTDIFSFGLVLYEMATGQRAFSGETAALVENAILNEPPLPARELNPALPPRLVATIDKALEKDRAQRYQSSAEMSVALQQLNTKSSRNVLIPWKRYAAAALLITIVVAGSLYWRSRRTFKLTQKDTIVLAHVVNNTGDTVMDDALDSPLFRKVAESPYVTVLYPSKVLDTLRLMKVSNVSYIYTPQTPKLTPELAREVCLRSESRAFVTAYVANTGNAYDIVLNALDCHSGKVLAKVERQTNDRNQIVKTLGAAGLQLRRELGEPENSLTKFNTPLENETSWSLEALQALSQAQRRRAEQGDAAAIPQYKRAIELDSNLAMAYLNLAGIYYGSGETSSMMPCATKAFALRERLSQRSRWMVEAVYYGITGELEKGNATFIRWEQTFPADASAHQNRVSCLARLGQLEEATVEARETVRLMPNVGSYDNLMGRLLFTNRLEDAKVVFQEAKARGIDGLPLRCTRYLVAFLQGDNGAMQEQISWAMARPETREWALQQPGDNATYHGQFRAARGFYSAMGDYSPSSAAIVGNWHVVAYTALADVETGRPIQARQAAERTLAAGPPSTFKRTLALVLARAGAANEAEKLAEIISQESPLDTLVQKYELPTIRAAIELHKGQPARAIEMLQSALPYDLAFPADSFVMLYPAYLRGLAYLQLGDGREAAAEFQKMVDHPGISEDFITAPLSHLQLGRAQAMMGDKAAARKSYQNFLTLWKDADSDIPIYKQAKAEYPKLR